MADYYNTDIIYYVTPDEVRDYLDVPSDKYSDTYLQSLILKHMDYIDWITETCWAGNEKTCREYHDITRPKWGFWIWRLGYPVFLTKCHIKELLHLEVFQGCIPEYELIYTEDGVKTMGEIEVGDKVEVFDNGLVKYSDVVDKVYTGYRKVYRIKARDYELDVTDNHPFLVIEKNGGVSRDKKGRFVSWNTYNFVWKRAKDLKVGDYVVVKRMKEIEDKDVEINGVKLTKELMYVLGFWLGDGNYGKRSVVFHVFGTSEFEIFEKAFSECFGKTVKAYSKNNYNDALYVVNSVDVKNWMKDAGFIGHADTKRVPCWIYLLPNNLQMAFIDGYIDADGWRGEYESSVSSINKWLLYDMKRLCNIVGYGTGKIMCDKKRKGAKGTNPLYRLNIYKNKKKYSGVLGERNSVGGILCKDLVDAGFSIRRITDIEYIGKEDVYDITVEGYHNFIANGFVVHNSEYQDWIGDPSFKEGRNNDYFVDYEEGIIYLNVFMIPMAGKEIRVEYTYGRDDLPGGIKLLCLYRTVRDLISNERRMFALPDGADAINFREQLMWLDNRIAELEEMYRALKMSIIPHP